MDFKVRIEEDNDFTVFLEILTYIAAFVFLLPLAVVWLIYKLIKWIIDKNAGKASPAYNTPVGFDNAYSDLLSLTRLKEDGLIDDVEYDKKRCRLVKQLVCHKASMSVVQSQMYKIQDLYRREILTSEEFEKKRAKLVKNMR